MGDRNSSAWTGWLLAVLMFAAACLQTLFEQQHMYRAKVLQMRLRTAITGLVYRKVSARGGSVSIHTAQSPVLLPPWLTLCDRALIWVPSPIS